MARRYHDNWIDYWQPYRDAMKQERAFVDGDRYQQDLGSHNRDRRLIQIRGQEIQDTTRHIVAEATKKPRSIQVRPINSDYDADTEEVVISIMEWETGNPWKGFEECYETALIAAREHRLGIVMLDWDPDCGPYGEILPRWADGTRFMWDPAYHPHHPNCKWMIEERRIDVDWVHDNFPGSEWVTPDQQAFDERGEFKSGIPLLRSADGTRLGSSGVPNDNKATLWFLWLKDDKTVAATREQQGSYEPIKNPNDRYLACTDCGYRSPPQGDLEAQGAIPKGAGLPPELPLACPTADCGGDLQRIDAHAVDEEVLAYSKGRRLIVTAPLSADPDDGGVFDGAWPVPECRSFPGFFFTCNVRPGKPMGTSDTFDLWDQQIGSDNLRTLMLQQVFGHQVYWEMPAVGINDSTGARFTFREDQKNVMYRDGSMAEYGPLNVTHHEGMGLDPEVMVAFNVIQAALTQYRGVTDIEFSPESSKDVPASTLAQLVQQKNVPIEHWIRQRNRELSRGYGVYFDMVRTTTPAAKLKRLRIDGIDHVVDLMSADDLPNYEFVIEESPEFTGLEQARAQAFDKLIQLALQAPGLIPVYARIHNLPSSVVRDVEQWLDKQQLEAQTMQAGMAGAGSGAGSSPAGSSPSIVTPQAA